MRPWLLPAMLTTSTTGLPPPAGAGTDALSTRDGQPSAGRISAGSQKARIVVIRPASSKVMTSMMSTQ
jgi:hypothetical protein